MNRLVSIALAALTIAPVARGQDASQQEAPPAPTVDVSALEGKVSALEEQFAEAKSTLAGLSKLKLSGYLQARWEQREAASSYYNVTSGTAASNGGPDKDNFYIRRGRFKAVYDADWSQYTIQIDVLPSGLSLKEGYASVKLPEGLYVDAGLQLFPFGYEVGTRSSSDLDLLERSLVTSAFLAGEYDLGVALRGARGPLAFRVGVFNGNGVQGTANSSNYGRDNDQLKDIIGRATYDLGFLTVGASGWYGKTKDYTRTDDKAFPRVRLGLDAQLFLDLLPIGGTAVKGEYMWGKTTIGSSSGGTFNGGAGGNLPAITSNAQVPTGSGWYALVTQNLGAWEQLAVRYEQYIPNHTLDLAANPTKVKVNEEVEVAAHTFVGGNYKLTAAWFHPMNGKKGSTAPSDPKTDEYIVQAQAKF